MTKTKYNELRIKEMMANPAIQEGIKGMITVPREVFIKQIANPYTNKETNETTQKIQSFYGTTIEDMQVLEFTLTGGQTLDGLTAMNKKYQIDEFKVSLVANMRGGNFNGYSPTGLKLLVTKLTEVKTDGKQS